MNPASVRGGQNALGPEDHAVLAGIQRVQSLLHGFLFEFLGSFHTPGGEHLVGIVVVMVMLVVVLMVMAAAGAVFVMVVVVMLMLLMVVVAAVSLFLVTVVVLVAALVAVMVMARMVIILVMVMMFVVVTAAAMVVILIVVVMMVMLMLVHQLGKLVCQRGLALHGGGKLLAGELAPGSRHVGGLVVMLPQQSNRGIQLGLGDGVGTGQNNGGGGLNLVVVELAEVLHIHLDLAGIHHGHGVAQRDLVVHDLLHRADDVGQLAHAGGLDENAVGVIFGDDLGQSLAEVAHQRAADAAGVHLGDADARVLQKAAVNADFAELILDQYDFLALVALLDHFLNQSGLAGAEKAGVNINFCHTCLTFPV